MQKIEVHPFSLIAGAAMAVLFLFACSSGSKTPPVSPAQNVNVINPVRLDPSAEVAINSLPTVQLDSSTSVSVSSLPKVELDASTAVRVSSLPNVHIDPSTAVKVSSLPQVQLDPSTTVEVSKMPKIELDASTTANLFHPQNIVNLVEGTSFTVPQGKTLIIKDFSLSACLSPDGTNVECKRLKSFLKIKTINYFEIS